MWKQYLQELADDPSICTVWLPLIARTGHKHSSLPARQEKSLRHFVAAFLMCSSIAIFITIPPCLSPYALLALNIIALDQGLHLTNYPFDVSMRMTLPLLTFPA
jgi:4-amino-4-deoxy-L-arabinose transferase-like glycosyltransferase